MKNVHFILLLTFLLQICIYFLGNDLVFYFHKHYLHGTPKRDIGWGLRVREISIFYVLIALSQCVGFLISSNKRVWIAMGSSLVYAFLVVPFLDIHTLRASILFVVGLAGIWVQVLVFRLKGMK